MDIMYCVIHIKWTLYIPIQYTSEICLIISLSASSRKNRLSCINLDMCSTSHIIYLNLNVWRSMFKVIHQQLLHQLSPYFLINKTMTLRSAECSFDYTIHLNYYWLTYGSLHFNFVQECTEQPRVKLLLTKPQEGTVYDFKGKVIC